MGRFRGIRRLFGGLRRRRRKGEEADWNGMQGNGHVKGDAPEPSEEAKNRSRRSSDSRRVHFSDTIDDDSRSRGASDASGSGRESQVKDFLETMIPTQMSEVPWSVAFRVLLASRMLSVFMNIVHDCDEVYNYWEPLHYVLHGKGLQTWEYSGKFGLRSWFYILPHAVPAMLLSPFVPFFPFVGGPPTFYAVRLALGIASAAVDAVLVSSLSRVAGKTSGVYSLLFLTASSGSFVSSTALLPSSFSMMFVTLSAASVLTIDPVGVVVTSGVGSLVGWPFAALASLPHGLAAVSEAGLRRLFGVGILVIVAVVCPMLLIDRWFYGRWVFAQVNLVTYNVLGGGDSALYGVEDWTFYFRNCFNNFNFVFVLALLSLPFIWIVARDKSARMRLLSVVASVYLWFSFMSFQAHKEERFLYVIYPSICLSAGVALGGIQRAGELAVKALRWSDRGVRLWHVLCWMGVFVTMLASVSRTTALINGYSAPIQLFRDFPSQTPERTVVCYGSEWHRFPSSFHFPSRNYTPAFVRSDFDGMLPMRFDKSLGGSAGMPEALNDQNRGHPATFVNLQDCTYMFATLEEDQLPPRGWEVLAERDFLDASNSPSLTRAFFVPYLSKLWNRYTRFTLLRRT